MQSSENFQHTDNLDWLHFHDENTKYLLKLIICAFAYLCSGYCVQITVF